MHPPLVSEKTPFPPLEKGGAGGIWRKSHLPASVGSDLIGSWLGLDGICNKETEKGGGNEEIGMILLHI